MNNNEPIQKKCEMCQTSENIGIVKVSAPIMGWDFQMILCPVCAFKKGLEHGELLTKYMVTSKNEDKGKDKTQ